MSTMNGSREGVLGVFRYLDSTTDAIRSLKAAGYDLTVYSPTPRHELEEAMEESESPVRIFTFVGGFTGTAAGASLALWASLDWPLIVGGKEIASIPAFVVIMFELTILLGALATLFGMFVASRLPRIGKGEAFYDPSFSAGSFGVFAHAPADRHDDIRRILEESGSEEVLVEDA